MLEAGIGVGALTALGVPVVAAARSGAGKPKFHRDAAVGVTRPVAGEPGGPCSAHAQEHAASEAVASGTAPPVAAPGLPGLREGQKLESWTLENVGALHEGAVPVRLRTASGVVYSVDVLRRSPANECHGVASTKLFSLFLANNGTGSTASDEEQGIGVMVLARHLQVAKIPSPPELLTFEQRRAAYPARERGAAHSA